MEGVVYFIIAVLIIGVAIFAVLFLTQKGTSQLDKIKYQKQWLAIESMLDKNQPATFEMCVIKADKLLDLALRERNFSGQTMGERLKSAQKLLTNNNAVWSAHKLRNRIAHEANVSVKYVDARHALSGFKRALKDMGAI